jgi:hypothetical protein
MKRHIINVSLAHVRTKEALKHLFYSDEVHVLSPGGKMETLHIPVHKRLYVMEDVDAAGPVVLKRSLRQAAAAAEAARRAAEVAAAAAAHATTEQRFMEQMRERDGVAPEDLLDMATLLNVFDGIRETPGRVVVLSSNYPERLDKALLRPGRFGDLVVEYRKHSRAMLRQMVEAFYDTPLSEAQAAAFDAAPALDGKWSPAEVSQILFHHPGDQRSAIRTLLTEQPSERFAFSYKDALQPPTKADGAAVEAPAAEAAAPVADATPVARPAADDDRRAARMTYDEHLGALFEFRAAADAQELPARAQARVMVARAQQNVGLPGAEAAALHEMMVRHATRATTSAALARQRAVQMELLRLAPVDYEWVAKAANDAAARRGGDLWMCPTHADAVAALARADALTVDEELELDASFRVDGGRGAGVDANRVARQSQLMRRMADGDAKAPPHTTPAPPKWEPEAFNGGSSFIGATDEPASAGSVGSFGSFGLVE